ncbi:MAG: hypothetical protein ACYDHM_15885 [Acidiferrobacterales bacterium]
MAHDLDLSSVPNSIDGAPALRRFVVNLFYGYGYNAYRQENKDRADDLLVRSEVSHWLTQARAALSRRESDYRRDHFKPPTREHPFPDGAAVEKAESYVRAQRAIEEIEVAVRNAPVPENNRVWQRHRREGDVLERLIEADLEVARCAIELLREVSRENFDPDTVITALSAVNAAMKARSGVLSIFR